MNTIKDEFVSVVSHDLKNPLTTILGYCDILDEKTKLNLNSNQRNMIDLIQSSVKHQIDIIKDLLNTSMFESGKMKLDKKEFPLINAIERVIEETKFKMDKKNIKIESLFDKSIKILGDEDRIVQVISNLVGNALKFTNDGGNIFLAAENKKDNILISVKDNGIGISQEDIELIFNPYKIFTTYGTKGERGTGLGLNICIRIISAHNGKIWVESEIGKGSVFYFTIPR